MVKFYESLDSQGRVCIRLSMRWKILATTTTPARIEYTSTEILSTRVRCSCIGRIIYCASAKPRRTLSRVRLFFGKNYGDSVVFSWRNRGGIMEILCAERYCGEPIEKM